MKSLLLFYFSIFILHGHHESKKVMILHSYHQGLQWTDEMTQGVSDVLNHSPYNIQLYIEYLDTKRNTSFYYFEKLADLYQSKTSSVQFDIIIACDNNAFIFASKYRDVFFRGIPIVFCGVSNFSPGSIQGISDITGVTESIDYRKTLDFIQKAHPNLETLYIINDGITRTSIETKIELLPVLTTYKGLNYTFLEELPIDTLTSRIKKIREPHAFLLLSFYKDLEGKYFSNREILHQIRSVSSKPIYAIWSHYVGIGAVGGYVKNGYTQGEKAAEIAVEIFKGTPVKDIPILPLYDGDYLFDYLELQRQNISERMLPEESRILNKPRSVFDDSSFLFRLSLAFLLLFTLVIVYTHKKRRGAESLFSDSEERYKQLAMASFESIVLHYDGVVIECNQRFADISGYSMETDIIGQPLSRFIFDYHPRKSLKNVVYEGGLTTISDRRLDIEIHERNYFYQGKEITILVLWDITERKERENMQLVLGEILNLINKKLIKSEQELQTLVATKDKFFSIIAHDLRGPIGTLSQILDVIVDRRELLDPATIDTILHELQDSTRKTYLMLENLLQWALAQRGGLSFDPINFAVSKLVRESIGLFKDRLQDKKLSIEEDVQPELNLYADYNMISTCFRNLLSNAIKFSHHKTSIKISARKEEEWATLSITDNGIGIPKADIARLFRIEEHYTRKGTDHEQGTGLGLILCKEFIEKNKGSISVLSEEGKGTTFTIRLPLKEGNGKPNEMTL